MLKGKNIVITGCTRGIGLAALKKCAQNGADIFAVVRNATEEKKELFEGIAKEFNVNIFISPCDLEDKESIKAAASDILSRKRGIDGIVNNAGITGGRTSFLMTRQDDIRQVFETNVFGPMDLTQRLLKNMIRARAGSVVNISSAAAIDGDPAQFGYVSSKAALIGATKKLSIELGSFGIRVNSVSPGVIETDMLSLMDPDVLERMKSSTVLKRAGKPEEVAELIVFLLSDKSSYITGQNIRIDGGMHM